MKNAVENAMLMNIILVFLFIMLGFLAGSMSYTKAYRIKNSIVNLIEREELSSTAPLDPVVFNDKAKALFATMGYRIVSGQARKCASRKSDVKYDTVTIIAQSEPGSYRYCVIKYTKYDKEVQINRVFYTVTTYMYFDIPLVSNMLEFPIYGETKAMFE